MSKGSATLRPTAVRWARGAGKYWAVLSWFVLVGGTLFCRIILGFGIAPAVPIVLLGLTRRRASVWSAGLAMVGLMLYATQVASVASAARRSLPPTMHGVQLGVNLIDIVLVTWVTDLAIVYYRQSRQRQEILTRQNIELAASRAEVARQNQFLEEQSQELDRRRAAAQEEADRKGRFLAAASHDIRTPANAISLLAELLQQSAATAESGGDVGELARELQKSATNLVALASDVLDVTRLDTGKVELRVTDFALAELIAEQCRQQKMIAEQKGLSLCCGTTEAGLMIRADRVKLSRVLANLIANGIKFTEKGDVSVRAALRSDGQLAVEVADTGIGIAPEFQEKIFDEYFQLRRPSKERERSAGSGLGLAICRRLIGAMGGRLEVRSEPGNGSTFSVILPATTVLGGGAVGGAAAAEMVVPLAS